jgi:hypothetical protein
MKNWKEMPISDGKTPVIIYFSRIYYRYERFDYKDLKTGILLLDFSKRYSKEILLTERKRKQ